IRFWLVCPPLTNNFHTRRESSSGDHPAMPVEKSVQLNGSSQGLPFSGYSYFHLDLMTMGISEPLSVYRW
ncbi:hypothetical protein AcV5_003528, partial [Taiwanofungus camphoratus]